jgi:hypothetical protein
VARWQRRGPGRIEPPEWYRNYHPEDYDEPDGHEQSMIDGSAGYRAWPDAEPSRWPDWPQWLHEEHSRRRWQQAKHAYRQAHPAFWEQEFNDLRKRHYGRS